MKIEAYRCDACNDLVIYEAAVGIELREDMFDPFNSFKPLLDPRGATVHHCTNCYHSRVFVPASVIDWAKDEPGYLEKVKELYYVLRKDTVLRAAKRARSGG